MDPQQTNSFTISSTEAAQKYGFTNDHVASLCRRRKVEGVLVDGRVWMLSEESLKQYIKKNEEEKTMRTQALSEQFKKEALSREPKPLPTVRPQTLQYGAFAGLAIFFALSGAAVSTLLFPTLQTALYKTAFAIPHVGSVFGSSADSALALRSLGEVGALMLHDQVTPFFAAVSQHTAGLAAVVQAPVQKTTPAREMVSPTKAFDIGYLQFFPEALAQTYHGALLAARDTAAGMYGGAARQVINAADILGDAEHTVYQSAAAGLAGAYAALPAVAALPAPAPVTFVKLIPSGESLAAAAAQSQKLVQAFIVPQLAVPAFEAAPQVATQIAPRAAGLFGLGMIGLGIAADGAASAWKSLTYWFGQTGEKLASNVVPDASAPAEIKQTPTTVPASAAPATPVAPIAPAVPAAPTTVVRTVVLPAPAPAPLSNKYLTEDVLTARLDTLSNSLKSLIYANSSAPNSLPATGGFTNTIALTNHIDQLRNVTLTNSIVSGVSGLTDADIPNGITASNYLPLSGGTVSGDLIVTGTCTGCGSGGSGGTFPFTPDSNYGAVANSTSTAVWFKSGLQASSTSQFVYASSTALTATTLYSTTATTSNFYGAGLNTCQSGSVLTYDGAGKFGCAADQTAAGAANPFTWSTNYAVLTAATSSVLWAQNGIFASSTSQIAYASTTALSATTLYSTTASTTNLTVNLPSSILSTAASGAVQLTTVSSPLSFSGSTLSIIQSGTGANGYLSSTDFGTFNNKISSSSLSSTFPIAYNSTTGAITFSGLSTSTTAVVGNIPYFSGANTFANVATGTVGGSGGVTVTAGQSIIGSGLTITCTGASASAAGCLSSADWSIFNNKISSTSLSAGSGISYNSSTGVISSTVGFPFTVATYGAQAVNATTTGLWLQGNLSLIASSTFSTYASTTQLSNSGNMWLTGLSAGGLGVNSAGLLYSGATSTLSTISGSLALTQHAAQAANTVIANGTGDSAVPTALATSSLFTGTPGQVLTFTNGTWVGVATTTDSCSSGISCSFSGSISSFTNSGVTSNVAGSGISVSGATGAVTITNTIGFPFTADLNYAALANATSTAVWFKSGIQASSTSQIAYASSTALTATTLYSTTASTTNLTVNLPSSILSTAASGAVQLTTVSSPLSFSGSTLSITQSGTGANGYLSSTDFGTFNNKISSSSLSAGSGISYDSSTGVISNTIAFPFTQTTFGSTNANATSTLVGFTGGLYATASSTIGNGAQLGGLTISGGATTTGNAYFGGTVGLGSSTPFATFSLQAASSSLLQSLFAIASTSNNGALSTLFSISNTGLLSGLGFSLGSGTSTNVAVTASSTVAGALNAVGGAVFGQATTTYLNVATLASTSALQVNGAATFLNGVSQNQALVLNTSGVLTATSSLAVNNGGTGVSTFASNGILFGNGTGALQVTASVNTGALVTNSSGVPSLTSGSTPNRVLRTDGTTISFAQLALGTDVSGTLPIANGGTNATTQVLNGLNFYNGTSITSSSTLTLSTAGAFGVGTTSPYALLSIHAASTSPSSFNTLFAIASTSALNATSTLFVVTNTGNVGIGTTSPLRLLSLNAAVSTAQQAIAYNTNNSTDILTSSVGDYFVYPSGQDALFNNSNLWVCTGGSGNTNGCPTGTPSGQGNLIVETRLGVASSTPWAAISVGAGGAIVTTEKSLTDGGTVAIDWRDGNQQLVTLGGNRTITFAGYIPGQTMRLVVCQDGTGSRTLSWPAAVLWAGGSAPTLTTTANKCDVTTFLTTAATSTVKIFGSSVANF
ncbi:hypothetical protein EXS62_01200 [Candidatus Kaiserbacteria bacterium]|nr:hypothetical protein [Candidatus Kaiserbacteria bacterium]